MFSFLSEFKNGLANTYTIIVMDEEGMEQPRQYRLQPRRLAWLWAGAALAVAVVMVALVVLTPLRELIPGYGTAEMRRSARVNVLRIAALEDSLAVQQSYLNQIRQLMMGQVDTTGVAAKPPEMTFAVSGELAEVAASPRSENWTDHAQPALPVARLSTEPLRPLPRPSAAGLYVSSLSLPVLPPVDGLLTRGFDARTGHYAIDLAVEEGTVVRAVGDGHVIFADWTYEGGHTLVIQHADGYVSAYKHNSRLLKRVGDRVRDREAITLSGNSGEITTGPHLHVELWRNGLAQDPRDFFIGL